MLAHVHIMKTAGQTVRGILRQSFGSTHCDVLARRKASPNDITWAQKFYPDLKSIAGHGVLTHANLENAGVDLQYFTFLREPLQRCVSHYQFSSPKKSNFPDFEKWLPTNANFQCRILCGEENASRAIEVLERQIKFVGLVERFNESLVLLQDWCGEELDLHYRSINVATDNTIKKRLLSDPKIMAQIEAANDQDYQVYRYARDVIYPRQLAKFGPNLNQAVGDLEAELPGPVILSFQQFVASAKRNMVYKPMTRIFHKAAA